LWDIVQAARALGIPASELVNGSAQLPSGTQTIWKELAYRGAPFLVTDADPLWAVRPVQETVADALLHPDPRQVDRLPGLLLVEDFPPRALWGLCADHGVDRRLGWIADIARTLAQFGSVPVQPRATRSIDVVLETVARPPADSSYDTLGFGAERPESLPPPSRRWRISYDQSIEGFAEAAQELAAGRVKRGTR
jgi:hypothetical protein